MTTSISVTSGNVTRVPAERLCALREGVRLSTIQSPHENCMHGKQGCGTHTCQHEPYFDQHNPDQKIGATRANSMNSIHTNPCHSVSPRLPPPMFHLAVLQRRNRILSLNTNPPHDRVVQWAYDGYALRPLGGATRSHGLRTS